MTGFEWLNGVTSHLDYDATGRPTGFYVTSDWLETENSGLLG